MRNQIVPRYPGTKRRISRGSLLSLNPQRLRGRSLTRKSLLLCSVVRHGTGSSPNGAGVFYLVNVVIALEFYGDFTTPAQPGLALPLWDFLAFIGERMIGDEFAEDPLPVLFAELSGRSEGEPPGAHFEPPTGEPLPPGSIESATTSRSA